MSAYNGAGRLIETADYLVLAGKIVSVEARHAALIRDLIMMGSFADDTAIDANGLDLTRKRSIEAIPIDVPVVTNSHVLIADTQRINEAFGGYYIALPEGYSGNTRRYPLIVFLHGLGQRGNGKKN